MIHSDFFFQTNELGFLDIITFHYNVKNVLHNVQKERQKLICIKFINLTRIIILHQSVLFTVLYFSCMLIDQRLNLIC